MRRREFERLKRGEIVVVTGNTDGNRFRLGQKIKFIEFCKGKRGLKDHGRFSNMTNKQIWFLSPYSIKFIDNK